MNNGDGIRNRIIANPAPTPIPPRVLSPTVPIPTVSIPNPLSIALNIAISVYLSRLQSQGQPQKIPVNFMNVLQKYYREKLDLVRYYENIDTGHGMAITIGTGIFFPSKVDFNQENDLDWLLHELEHVDQYKSAGSIENFLWHYFLDAAITMLTEFTFNPHNEMGTEQAADRKKAKIRCAVNAELRNKIYWQLSKADQFFTLKNRQTKISYVIAVTYYEEEIYKAEMRDILPPQIVTQRSIGVFEGTNGNLSLLWKGNNWINFYNQTGDEGWCLRPGDKFITADIDGDKIEEIIVVNEGGTWIGVLKINNGVLNARTIKNDWVGAWQLRKGDQFFVGDIDGDGKDEIIVFSGGDGKHLGVIREQNGALSATSIKKDWVGGWQLHKGDQFYVADIDGDGKDELIVFSGDGKYLGIIREQNGTLVTLPNSIIKDKINGWQLHRGDKFYIADIDGDSRDEIIVFSGDGKYLGIIREQNGTLVTLPNSIIKEWAGGWHLNKNDQFYVADINGDGKSDLIVSGGAGGRDIGIIRENNGVLSTVSLFRNRIGALPLQKDDQLYITDLDANGKEEIILLRNKQVKVIAVIQEVNSNLILTSIHDDCILGKIPPVSPRLNLASSTLFPSPRENRSNKGKPETIIVKEEKDVKPNEKTNSAKVNSNSASPSSPTP